MAANIIYKNTGRKTSKINRLFESDMKYSFLKSFTGLGFYARCPWTPTGKATQLHPVSGQFTFRCCF